MQESDVDIARRCALYLRRMAFFAALLAGLGAGLAEFVAFRTSVAISPQAAAVLQQDVPSRKWLGAFLDYGPYKAARAILQKPEVLVIGSSRCGEFRAAMFAPYAAYNACFTSWTLDQAHAFVARVAARHKPRVVVFTLDYFMFADAFESSWRAKAAMHYTGILKPHVHRLKDGWESFLKQPWLIWRTIIAPALGGSDGNRDYIGLHARRLASGFRADGSLQYSAGQLAGADAFNAQGAMYFLQGFQGAPEMSPRQIEALRRFAGYARANGIQLVGVQLPMPRAVTDYLDNEPSYRHYAGVWRQFRSPETAELLNGLGIAFLDMSMDPVGGDNRHFVDPVHPNEAGTLGGLLRAAQTPAFRAAFPLLDPARLRADLERAYARNDFYNVYPDDK